MQALFEKILKLQYPATITIKVVKTALANQKITAEGYERITGTTAPKN